MSLFNISIILTFHPTSLSDHDFPRFSGYHLYPITDISAVLEQKTSHLLSVNTLWSFVTRLYSFTVSGSLGILGIQLELRLSKMLSLERHIGHKADRWKQVLRYVTKSRCLEGSALVAQPYSESRYCSTSVAKVYRIDYKICPPGVR
jgi:hypothetical protein